MSLGKLFMKGDIMINSLQRWIQNVIKRKNKFLLLLSLKNLDEAIDIFKKLQSFCWLIPFTICGMHIFFTVFPIIRTLNFQFSILLLTLICICNMIAIFVVNRYLFYFYSNQLQLDSKTKKDKLWSVQKTSNIQVSVTIGSILGLPLTFTVLPYIQFLYLHPTVTGWTVRMTDAINGNTYILRVFIMSIPVIVTFLLYQRFFSEETIQKTDIDKWMVNFHYHDPQLHSLLTGIPIKSEKQICASEPYMILGTSIETGDIVELTPIHRKENSVYFGPVGAGKTSTIFIPQILQDVGYYLRYIRDFPKISKNPDYLKTKRNIATKYLNGFAVIETSNDLCSSVYQLCLNMGVPKEKIIWLDPTNPKTPSLNLLRGPVDTVVETVTNIIAGVKADNNDFFQQSERTHLKNFIYLLRFSGIIENKIVTFTDLVALYNDLYLVVDKIKILDKYVYALNAKVEKAKKEYESEKSSTDKKTRYQELYDKYEVALGTSKWFHSEITPAMFGKGIITQKTGPHEGEPMWIDKQEENIRGLKNTLDDLSKNKYLRRVLFRDSGEFNLDDLLKNGGILLCNTAKAELQDQLANRLGQIYLMSFQNATIRRKPDKVPMFPLYADEFPDFVSEAFKSFVAQARKYNVPIIVAAQSPSQLSYTFGKDFFNTLMSNMLTRGTFGDLGAEDAKILEPYFGEKSEITETINDQQIDLTADLDSSHKMISARRSTVPNITASELQSLARFNIAIRHPAQHGSEMFEIIKTKFLTDEDIRNNPNVFDINDARDHDAFANMMKNTIHINSDLDAVDLEIVEDIKKDKLNIKKTRSKGELNVSGLDADSDLNSNHVSSRKVKEKSKEKLEFAEIARNAVHSGKAHGGNNRLNNNIQTLTKLPEPSPNKKLNSSDLAKILESTGRDNDQGVTKHKIAPYTSESSALVEKHISVDLETEKRKRSNVDKEKQTLLLQEISRLLVQVANSKKLNNFEKLEKLNGIPEKEYDEISRLLPGDHDKILAKHDSFIAKQKAENDAIKQKNYGRNLAESLSEMIGTLDNSESFIDDDGFVNTNDRFMHQHGMDEK